MGTPIKTYKLSNVYLLLGGYRIGGFGESGGVEFEYGADLGEATVGADGQTTFSYSNDNTMTATITVMETSKSYKDLAALMQAQVAQEVISRLEFLMNDEVNGDKISDKYATFVTRPTPNKAKKAGERVFKILLPNAGETAKFGALISI